MQYTCVPQAMPKGKITIHTEREIAVHAEREIFGQPEEIPAVRRNLTFCDSLF